MPVGIIKVPVKMSWRERHEAEKVLRNARHQSMRLMQRFRRLWENAHKVGEAARFLAHRFSGDDEATLVQLTKILEESITNLESEFILDLEHAVQEYIGSYEELQRMWEK